MHDRHTIACPACGRVDPETDFDALKSSGGLKITRSWDEAEGKSLQLSFDPSGIKQLKQEAPSIELDRHGDVVFRSDGHQRRVYREIAATRKRYAEESQARLDRRKASAADVHEAAGAVRQFIKVRAREGEPLPGPITSPGERPKAPPLLTKKRGAA